MPTYPDPSAVSCLPVAALARPLCPASPSDPVSRAQTEDETPRSEDREARRRMARERQQRLMRQFANRQRQFQEQLETGEISPHPLGAPPPWAARLD